MTYLMDGQIYTLIKTSTHPTLNEVHNKVGVEIFLMLLVVGRNVIPPLSHAGVVIPPDSVGKRTP